MLYGLGEYGLVVVAVAILSHALVRHYPAASLGGAAFAAVLNLAHETWKANFQVNLGWAPGLLFMGFVVALPITCGIGLPFLLVRRHRRVEA